MQLPIRIDKEAEQSLQLQLFEQIRLLIADGRLKPGTPMPASRVLATDLAVSRNTVVQAYERLASEGYIEVRKSAGTFVAEHVILDSPVLAEQAADDGAMTASQCPPLVFCGDSHVVVSPYAQAVAYDFWVGRPDARLFPGKAMQRVFNASLRRMRFGISNYSDPEGLPELREAVVDYVGAARGIKATADQVLIVNGIQEGLNILARLFVRRDVAVALENPCYRGAANVFASYGAQLMPVAVDADGIDVDHLPGQAAFVYLTPSHQYPTGATLSLQRRTHLLDWAQRTRAYVVEDDYDSDFYYDSAPLPALQSMDEQERVIYLGTFSKCLAPGLRIGYMVLPRHLVASAVTVKALFNNCTSWLAQALLAEFLASGAFMHHLRRIRTTYRARRDGLIDALKENFGDVEIKGEQGGMHLVWQLPAHFPVATELERRCRLDDVGIYSGDTGNAMLSGDAQLRYQRMLMLGYAALDENEIAEGVGRMAAVLEPEESGYRMR